MDRVEEVDSENDGRGNKDDCCTRSKRRWRSRLVVGEGKGDGG